MPTSPAVTNSDSLISLSTVSEELNFIGQYLKDYHGTTPSPAEKDRIRTALFQAQADLDFVVKKIIKATLGDQDLPTGEQTAH
jgi:hypothetical protein